MIRNLKLLCGVALTVWSYTLGYAQCAEPTDLTVSAITSSSAQTSWTSSGSLFDLQLINVTDTDTTYSNGIGTTSFGLIGLDPEKDYEVAVRTDCGPFTTPQLSVWTSLVSFTTPPSCPPISALTLDLVSADSAVVSWTQGYSENLWDLELVSGTDTLTYTPTYNDVTANTYTLSGLSELTDYTLIVRADCGGIDGVSAWSNELYFSTLAICQQPTDLLVGGISNATISFSWNSNDDETSWDIEVVNISNSETQDGSVDHTSSDTTYLVSGLDSESEYEIYVRANCGVVDGNSLWSGPLEVTTMCDPVSVPYALDFVTWPPACVDMNGGNGSFTQYTNSTDTAAMANFYSLNNADYYMTLPIINLTQTAELSFEWSHAYSSSYPNDKLEVFVSSDNGATWSSAWMKEMSDFESNDGAGTFSPGSFVSSSLLLDYTTLGSNVMIRFIGHSGWGPYLFIKSIAVNDLPACNVPYYVAVDSVSGIDADFSFTVAGSGATSYEVELLEAGNAATGVATDTVTGTPFNLSGLNPGTTYSAYIRTMCGIDSTIWVGPYSFTTECAALYDYATDFEGYDDDEMPNCWNVINDASSIYANAGISTWSAGAYQGSNSIELYNSSSTGSSLNQLVVAPEFTTLATGSHRMRFWANGSNDLVVGTMSDPTDYTTFSAFDTVLLSSSYTQYIVEFADYSGTDNYVALKNMGDNSYSYIYIDNFEWQEIPSCFPPASVTVDSTSLTSVSVSLDSAGTFGSEWIVEIVDPLGNNPTVIDTVNTTNFTIAGLIHSSVYEMTISSYCTDVESESVLVTFSTDCIPETLDYLETFVDAEPSCYDFSGGNTSFAHYTNGGNTALVADFWNDSDGTYHMTTPEMEMDSAARFGFKWSYASSSWSDKLEVFISNDGATWSSIWMGEGSTLGSNDGAGYTSPGSFAETMMLIDSSYIGSNIQFKFIATSDYGPNLYIDEIKVEYLPECETPADLVLDTVADIFATVDWSVMSLDTVWGLELVNVSSGDTSLGVITDTVYSHPHTFTGLDEGTIYNVYLTSLCDTSNTWLGPLTIVTQWSNDIGVSSILSPASSGCNLSDSLQIEVEITNYAAQAQSGFPIELSWDDSIYVNVGTFMDTLQPGESASFVIDGYYDFSTALDTAFWIQTALVSDSVSNNNSASSSVTNLGDMLINVEINTGDFGYEVYWAIEDTVNGITSGTGSGYDDFETYNQEVCVYAGSEYVMNSYDSWGDGWNGGTYSITRCGGIVLANNNGQEVTNGTSGSNDLEAQESFLVEACPDYDLAVLSIDGLESGCGLGLETGTVSIMNFGNLDVATNGATAQYQFNNSGLWVDFWDFDTGLASQDDTVMTMPAVDMSVIGMYTIDVRIVFALDEDTTTNYLSTEITSVPTLSTDSTDFNTGNGGWTAHIDAGINNSWQYGIPTTTIAGNGNDQEVWATNLTGNASLNEESYLLSPCYDFSSYTNDDVEVKFDFIRTAFSHSFRLQYELNGSGSWNSVYTAPSSTNTWTSKTILVPVGGESDVKFRWFYDATWFNPIEGFAFDNWEVFEHVPYMDATASYINVNGTLVQGFDPDTLNYDVELPYGSSLPNVTAGFNAPIIDGMDVDQAGSLPGSATVTITAEDTSYVNVYTVNFTEAAPNTDASLSGLAVSGPSIPGFDSDTLSYTMYMNCGITPNIVATVSDPNAIADVTLATNPGVATVVVTAEDGITTQTYYVNLLCYILSDDARLSDLTVSGTTVPGYSENTLVYNVELPYGTTTVPNVGFSTSDLEASVSINVAPMLPGTTTVEVTAEDGVTVITYVVNFILAPNDDASLLDLAINGGTVTGFDAAVYMYSVELGFNEPIPDVTGLATDANATVEIEHPAAVPGTTVITVTAEDGTTIVIYYINWTVAAASNDASLLSITSDIGVWCTTFDSNIYSYTVTVGGGVSALTNLTVVPNHDSATYEITGDAIAAPYGNLVITVIAQDGFTIQTYNVEVIAQDCNVGLDEAVLEQISVSPNPSNGMFTISVPAEMDNYIVAVVDQLGKVVYQETVMDEGMDKDVDLSSLPSGIYNLRIQTENDYIVKRISIVK